MFLVYESRHGEELLDCEPTGIIGVYDTKERAIDIVERYIESNKEYGYLLDMESDNLKEITIMFRDYQENWSDYFEIHILELELNKTIYSLEI